MGLDAVELIIEVEEAFDVQISDQRAGGIRTVGDLYNLILESRRDDVSPRDVCLTSATFFLVRRGLVRELEIEPKSIRPSTSVDATLPDVGRRQLWAGLQNSLGLKLPSLARPRWLVVLATTVVIAVSVLAGLLAFQAQGNPAGMFVTLTSIIILGLLARQLTQPLARHSRQSFETFRGLSHVVLAHNYATLSRQFNTWNPTDVWDALRIIIVEQLGVKPELVTKDASFSSDLGLS